MRKLSQWLGRGLALGRWLGGESHQSSSQPLQAALQGLAARGEGDAQETLAPGSVDRAMENDNTRVVQQKPPDRV